MTDDTLHARQRDLEMEMVQEGAERYRRLTETAQTKGREATTIYGRQIIKKLVVPVAERVQQFLDDAQSGKPGPKHRAVALMAEHEPLVLAFIVARSAMNTVSSHTTTLTSTSLAVGGAVENECRYAFYSTEAGKLFSFMLRALRERTPDERWRRSVMVHTMNKHGFAWPEWSKTDKLHVGQALVHCLIEATGLFEVTNIVARRNRQVAVFTARPELIALASSQDARCALLSPTKLPMLLEPEPWVGPYGGGYHYLPEPMPVITGRVSRNYLEELSNTGPMADIYDSLNAIQSVPWKINERVLSTLRTLWDRSGSEGIAGLPGVNPIELPPKPHDIATNKDARRAWRSEAAEVHRHNKSQGGRRVMVNSIIWLAEKFADEAQIFFPHQLDFRGRVYAVPTHLSPQGHDVSRGLLQFSKGKPIENDRAAGWLMIQGANMYGFDKASFEDRIGWVEEMTDRILAVAEDPMSDMLWAEADKPWQFLAWCFDYAGLLQEGHGYVSYLPVALDGSCNGLQHFSAMLRDPVGARATNLIGGEIPADVYQEVADRTTALLRERAGADELARKWLDVGVDRKICKRPVMIVPYSGTQHAARSYISAHMQEHQAGQWADKDAVYSASFYLAPILWKAIDEVVVAARQAMSFLTRCASITTGVDRPIQWTTPDGFPVVQTYWSTKDRSVKTRMGDRLIYLTVRETVKGGKMDLRDQKNGIAPNFVHSMDAAALRQYVLLARDNGVTSFALVHDSYATHAADTDMSAACLRHAFVSLYEDVDVLARFRDQVVQGVAA